MIYVLWYLVIGIGFAVIMFSDWFQRWVFECDAERVDSFDIVMAVVLWPVWAVLVTFGLASDWLENRR